MPSRLQLAELEQLIAASDALSFMAESAGARPVHTLRNAIQLQCKTFLEDMHTHSLTQLTGQISQIMFTMRRSIRSCAHSVQTTAQGRRSAFPASPVENTPRVQTVRARFTLMPVLLPCRPS